MGNIVETLSLIILTVAMVLLLWYLAARSDFAMRKQIFLVKKVSNKLLIPILKEALDLGKSFVYTVINLKQTLQDEQEAH